MRKRIARALVSVVFLALGLGALGVAALVLLSDIWVHGAAAALVRQDARGAHAYIAALEKLPGLLRDDFAVEYYRSRKAYAVFYETQDALQLAAAEESFFSAFQEAQKRGDRKAAAQIAYDRGTMMLEAVAEGRVAGGTQARSFLERAAYWLQIALTLEAENEEPLHKDAQWNLELTLRLLFKEGTSSQGGDEGDPEDGEGQKPGNEPGGRQGGSGLTHPSGY